MNIYFKILTLTGFSYYPISFGIPFLTIFNLNLLVQTKLSDVSLKICCLALIFQMLSFMFYFLILDFSTLHRIFL